MELSSNKAVRLTQEEISEAVLSLVFKKKPELRPTGVDTSEGTPKVNFSVTPGMGVEAIVMLEDTKEEIVKT